MIPRISPMAWPGIEKGNPTIHAGNVDCALCFDLRHFAGSSAVVVRTNAAAAEASSGEHSRSIQTRFSGTLCLLGLDQLQAGDRGLELLGDPGV
jgi:hypothetical protein